MVGSDQKLLVGPGARDMLMVHGATVGNCLRKTMGKGPGAIVDFGMCESARRRGGEHARISPGKEDIDGGELNEGKTMRREK